MSTEQIISNSSQDQVIGTASRPERKIISNKVDINVLLERVRVERKKEKKENLIFLSLISSVIVITAIIASF